MNPPSVLLVTKGLDIGGIERVVVDLAGAVAERDVPVEVAVVNGDRDGLAGVLAATGVPLRSLGGTDHIGLGAARRLAALVRDRSFDVVHVHGPLPAVLARLVRRGGIVTTAHTPWQGMRAPVRAAWRATASADAALVAVSAAVAASFPRSLAARARVIPHGIDPAAVSAALAAAETAGPAGAVGPTVALAVASHRDVKNYPNLLQAVRVAIDRGADLRLVAVGEGPDLERHRALAAELGLVDVVEFRPPAPDILGVIAAADLLVVASDFEGQPLVVSEALALGRPVAATAVGRVAELVSPDVGRVVPPGDPQLLGAAILELASDPDLRRSMGDTARRVALRWTLDDAVDAHLALYDEVRPR